MGFGPIYKRGFFNNTNVFNYARVFFFRFPVASAELLPPHLCRLQFVPPIYAPIVGRFHEKKTRPAFVPNCLLVLPSSQIPISHLIELDGPGAVGGFRLILSPPFKLFPFFLLITHKLTGGKTFWQTTSTRFLSREQLENWSPRSSLPVDVIQLAWREGGIWVTEFCNT